MKVTSWRIAGGHYTAKGQHFPGFGEYTLENGATRYVPENEFKGIEGLLTVAENDGHEVSEQRTKLDNWVKTGVYA